MQFLSTTQTMDNRTNLYSRQILNVAVVYNVYRIVMPLVLLITFASSADNTLLGATNSTLFVQVTTGYAIFGAVITFLSAGGGIILNNQRILTSTFIADILAITLLMYASSGVASGLGLLLIVATASGSIMIRGRISIFLAAVATLAVFYCEIYLRLEQVIPNSQFVQTGILGIIMFATSSYIQVLTDRIYRAAQLADLQASSIVDLEKLNNEIIQRMRTGIVVVNADSRIVSMNSSAEATLGPLLGSNNDSKDNTADTRTLASLPEIIRDQLALWKLNPKRQPQPVTIPRSNKQVQLNFAFLNPEHDSDVLIFMEDNLQIVQRVRQMKLASLGRLTASIAHEVRNPLGAISHASQLLRESETIGKDDKRMLEIILNHCNRVNMIIEDVLGASRQNDSSPTRINLKQWLENFIDSYEATHEQCDQISLTIEPAETEINIITGQFEQILNNLFDNGLRYSQKQTGKATLTLKGGQTEKAGDIQPYLHVIDDGAGIDEEGEAQLFEPFHTTEDGGTGLGLYISKELCEANQSQLVYGRTAAGKSCFSIYFSHPDRSME